MKFLAKMFRRLYGALLPLPEKPLQLQPFNEKFVSANQELAKGNTEGLKAGIGLLIESLKFSGSHSGNIRGALRELYCALSHHDRADTKGPWNRDLSGYGLLSWKNDLWDRDHALMRAWPHIEVVNGRLKDQGLGWKP